ncbi:MAG: FadR/GntR family transcriptional regulator [Chloroflexota bacterium]
MNIPLEPLKVPSLKEACIARLEQLILSGELQIGERLPSEREFAARLGVSRPVLHEALVDLAAKGLVEISPRRGVYVCDYRRSGSVAILSSLLSFHNGQFGTEFTQSMLELRLLLESETAYLAALHRTAEQQQEFEKLLEAEQGAACDDAPLLTELDFSFHLNIAIASGNLVYPLIINSFKGVYTSLSGQFFRQYCGSAVVGEVHNFHAQLVRAIEAQRAEAARQIMVEMLRHGERYLKGETV